MRAHEIFEAAEPKFSGATYSDRASLKKAIASVWGEGEYNSELVKSTGSRMGFTLGVYHLKNEKGEVVGKWETTDADKVPGRGAVTFGYGQVADKPKTGSDKKSSATKPADPSGPATPEELASANSDLLSAFKKSANHYTEFRSSTNSFEVRYWGSWENPEDTEDEEDYDWQQLTSQSLEQLKQIVNAVRAKYPNVKVDVSSEEKNWIYVQTRSKL